MADNISILIKSVLQAPSPENIKKVETEIKKTIGDVNFNVGNKRIKLLDDKEIDRYTQKFKNAIERLQVGKIKVFSDTRVTEELNKMSIAMEGFRNRTTSLKDVNLQFDNLKTKVAEIGKASEKSAQSITGMIGKFASWLVIGTIVMQPVRAFEDMLKIIKEVDTSLIEINKVLDLNKEQLKSLTKEATQLGIAYGRTTTEILNSIGAFAKAGLDKQASVQMTELAALLSNVGDMSTEMAEETLIATNAGFQLGNNYQRLNLLISEFNELANKNAIEVDTLSDAWKSSASIAKQAQLSIEQYNALITVSGSATQKSGKEIGNSWKTVLMRLQGVSDGVDTLEEDVGKAEEALNSIGIAVRKSPTEWRPAMEVLEEFAKKYKELGEQGRTVEQSAVTEALAGKYRANILAATLQNFDQIKKALQDQVGAMGSAEAENSRYMDSIQARTKVLSATWEQMTTNLINSDWIKNIISGLTQIVIWIDKTNAIIPVLAGVISTVLVIAVKSLSISIKSLVADFSLLNVFMGGLPIIIGLAVTGLTAFGLAISNNISKIDELTNKQKELEQSYKSQIEVSDKSLDSKQGELKVTESLAKKLEDLTSQENLNVAQKIELKSVVDQLNQALPNLNLQIDNQTGKIIGNTSAIYDNIEALNQQAKAQAYQKKATDAGSAYVNQEDLIANTQTQLDIEKNKLEKIKVDMEKEIGGIIRTIQNAMNTAPKELKSNYKNQLESVMFPWKNKIDAQQSIVNKYNEMIANQTNLLNQYQEDINKYTGKVIEYTPKQNNAIPIDSSKTSSSYYIPPKKSELSTSISAEKEVSSALLEKDRYAKLNQELQKTNSLIAENKALQENADIQTRISLLEKEEKLIKQKQDNLHNIAEESRRERDEISKTLSLQGVKFSGRGDSLTALNAQEVLNNKIDELNARRNDKNKTRYNELKAEYEDLSKSISRFFDLQTKEIPNLGIEWQNLSGDINKAKAEIIKSNEEIFNSTFTKFEKKIKDLDNTLKSLSDSDFKGKQEIIKQEILLVTDQIEMYKSELNKLETKYSDVSKRTEEVTNRMSSLQDAVSEGKSKINELTKSLEDLYQQIVDARISIEEDILESLKDIYTKEYEAKKEAKEKEYDLEIKNLNRLKELNSRNYDEQKFTDDQKFRNEELAKLQTRYNKILLDPTAAKEKFELEREMSKKIKEIKDAEVEYNLRLEENRIDDLIADKEEEKKRTLDEDEKKYKELIENASNFSDELNDVMSRGQQGILTFLIENSKKFKEAGLTQGQELINGWKEKLDLLENEQDLKQDLILTSLNNLKLKYQEAGNTQGSTYIKNLIDGIESGKIKLDDKLQEQINKAITLATEFSNSGTDAGKGLADNIFKGLSEGKSNIDNIINDYLNNLLKFDMMSTNFAQIAIDLVKSGYNVDSDVIQTALKNRMIKMQLMTPEQLKKYGITDIQADQSKFIEMLRGLQITTPITNAPPVTPTPSTTTTPATTTNNVAPSIPSNTEIPQSANSTVVNRSTYSPPFYGGGTGATYYKTPSGDIVTTRSPGVGYVLATEADLKAAGKHAYDSTGKMLFDLGGKAYGKGVMIKDTLKPERVLSPKDTESFDRLVDILGQLQLKSSSGGTTNNPSSVNFNGDIVIEVEQLQTDSDYAKMANKAFDAVRNRMAWTGNGNVIQKR